ncbi:MAG: MarR family transcriptional regulator [Dehalococcoidia bacterium]
MAQNADLIRFVTRIEIARRERQELNERVVAATTLTLNQCLVLSEVEHENGRATVSTLALTLGRAVHTLTSAINGLERKGLVMRTSMPGEDRRIVRIVITSKGSGALERFRKSAAELVDSVDERRLDREPPEAVVRASDAMLRLLQGPQGD